MVETEGQQGFGSNNRGASRIADDSKARDGPYTRTNGGTRPSTSDGANNRPSASSGGDGADLLAAIRTGS